MKREDLEHVIRAAADISMDDEIIVIGSQAILGQFPDAPAALLVSVEADVYPRNHPERSDLIDGTIGEGSPFHEAFGAFPIPQALLLAATVRRPRSCDVLPQDVEDRRQTRFARLAGCSTGTRRASARRRPSSREAGRTA